MTTPIATYQKKPNVRFRPMGEWNMLLAYTPDNPNVVCLNTTSWLILETLDGRGRSEAADIFLDAMGDVAARQDAQRVFDEGVTLLEERGVVEAVVQA